MDKSNENNPEDIVSEGIYAMEKDGSFLMTEEVKRSYWEDGYIIIRGILDEEEMNLIEKGWTDDPYLQAKKYDQADDKGDKMWLAVWDDASNDVTGLFSRSQKLAGTIQQILGEEIYHYHAKFLEKPPKTGGSFIWHQDYGYWYYNGTLFPDDMCTAFLAVDDIDMENGCIKIIPKSHKSGRVDHIKYDAQIQADLERVEQYKERLGIKQVVLKKGDVIIFHSNVLHRSDANQSDRRRLALAIAYNTKRNNPTKIHHHPLYKKLDMVDNQAVLEWGRKMEWDSTKHFYDPTAETTHMTMIDDKKD